MMRIAIVDVPKCFGCQTLFGEFGADAFIVRLFYPNPETQLRFRLCRACNILGDDCMGAIHKKVYDAFETSLVLGTVDWVRPEELICE
jgi:hypothetical protein